MKKLTYTFFLLVLLAGCNSSDIIQPNKQLDADIVAIDQYLDDNDIDAVKHSSGIRYRILEEGTGTKPEIYHYVRVKYKGMLMNEEMTVFDESPTTDPPYSTFILSGVIQGWQIGIKLLPEGSKAVLYIPSALAYGKAASPSIPANSNLIFEVELLDVIE
jgi:FKBP-type peptidyl-prolyl cis-trans isomerase